MTGLTETVRRRRTGGIDRATKTATQNFIRRVTTFSDVDLDRLDGDEQARLVQVVNKATHDLHGHNWERLSSKERKVWETLAEKAAGRPGAFKAERDAASLGERAAALARRAARPKAAKPGGESGLFELLGDYLARNILHAEHVLVFTVVLAQLVRAEPLAPLSRIEGEGENVTLVADRKYGVLGVDHNPEAELLTRWIEPLEHLAVNNLLDVERDGPTYRIKIGSRTRRALWGPS